MPYNISHLCGAIVSSFNGEQLKKCDSLYISKGIREYSRGVFITHDLGDTAVQARAATEKEELGKIHLNACLTVTRFKWNNIIVLMAALGIHTTTYFLNAYFLFIFSYLKQH